MRAPRRALPFAALSVAAATLAPETTLPDLQLLPPASSHCQVLELHLGKEAYPTVPASAGAVALGTIWGLCNNERTRHNVSAIQNGSEVTLSYAQTFSARAETPVPANPVTYSFRAVAPSKAGRLDSRKVTQFQLIRTVVGEPGGTYTYAAAQNPQGGWEVSTNTSYKTSDLALEALADIFETYRTDRKTRPFISPLWQNTATQP